MPSPSVEHIELRYRFRLIGGTGHRQIVHLASPVERLYYAPHCRPNPFTGRIPEFYYLVRLRKMRGVMVAESALPGLRSYQSIRAEIAEHLLRDAGRFTVCENCAGISPRGFPICPNCHAYRFDDSREAMRAFCTRYAERPPAWHIPDLEEP